MRKYNERIDLNLRLLPEMPKVFIVRAENEKNSCELIKKPPDAELLSLLKAKSQKRRK